MAVVTHEPHGYWEQTGLALLSFAMLAGPAAVALNIGAGYALVKWACATGHTYVLTTIALFMLALSLCGAWVGWACRARAASACGNAIADRSYFVASVGVGLSLLSALVIVMQAYPHFVLSPCE
jgi:hypothetical protein